MNRYFNNVVDLFSGSKAKASDIEAHFSLITTGLDLVQTEMDAKLAKAGGVMTGPLDMGSQKIIALANPTNPTDAVNLNYVTALFGDTATATAQAGIATTQAGIATTKASEATASAIAAAASVASIAGGPVASVNGMTGVVTGIVTNTTLADGTLAGNFASLTVTSPALLGYGTGAGGTVTQATSKSTAVTLNKPFGVITTHSGALAAGVSELFFVNNSLSLAATGVGCCLLTDGVSNPVNYSLQSAAAHTSGGFYLILKNTSTGSLSDGVKINFWLTNGATA